MRHKIVTLIASASFLALGISSVHAQFSQPAPIQYTVSPEAPGPNAPVYIEMQGIGSFLGDALITWQQDGKTTDSGVGHTTYSFTTGAVGSITRIHVTVKSSEGTFTHDFVFAPSIVDLVWEANTSAPPFFAGKPLYSAGSSIRVVAFPLISNGKVLIPISKLSFQWLQGDSPNPSASGLGRNSFAFDGDELHSGEDVSVDILFNGTKLGHGEISIPAVQPQVVMYDQDPLRGELLDVALPNSFNLNLSEITLKAEPYFFANQSLGRSLSYDWTLNGGSVSGPQSNQGLLTLRQTGQGSGSAQVAVNVQNTDSSQFTQSASQSLQFAFGGGGSPLSSLFGL